MIDISTTNQADREIVRAFRWYLNREPAAAKQFYVRLGQVYERILQSPVQHPVYAKHYRYLKVAKYPYIVVYELIGTRPLVVAVNHCKRSKQFWKRRLR